VFAVVEIVREIKRLELGDSLVVTGEKENIVVDVAAPLFRRSN
jgi:hypothetical protein